MFHIHGTVLGVLSLAKRIPLVTQEKNKHTDENGVIEVNSIVIEKIIEDIYNNDNSNSRNKCCLYNWGVL